MTRHRLIDVHCPSDPAGIVVVLHGGANRPGSPMVSPTQLSVIRMVPVARRVARAGHGRLAVVRLLNSMRGWDLQHTPEADARWAVRELLARYPGRPVGLIGHSLGGRAALLAGGERGVRSVVALNPWVYAGDAVDLSGRRVLIVHGDGDRIASPQRSARVAATLRRRTEVDYVTVPGGKHAMLRHGGTFERLAAEFTVDVLLPGDE